jgi:hypothetical protein
MTAQPAVAADSARKLNPARQPPNACRDITTALGSTSNNNTPT